MRRPALLTRPGPTVGVRLYETMLRVRVFEEAVARLWHQGLISGEIHSSVGEEAVAAGVVDHLGDGDALAVDHRSTGPLVARGLAVVDLLRELLGHEDGLCRGRGGRMHLLSRDHLAVSDGIVGATGPLACGFALAARHRRPGRVAVAFFGEGAMNQGMLLEAFNLAAVWHLPVLFVCKDSRWAITTRSRDVTAGALGRRATSCGLVALRASGSDVAQVWTQAGRALRHARRGRPAFLEVRVHRPEGHLLDDAWLRLLREPGAQARAVGTPLVRALRRPGRDDVGGARALAMLTRRVALLAAGQLGRWDPLRTARRRIGEPRAVRAERRAVSEIAAALDAVVETAS